MKNILRTGGDGIELNALFIQPTRWCDLNCTGCYVKKHAPSDRHVPKTEIIKLFQQFHNPSTPHWANQITVSIDNIPDEPKRHLHMMRIHWNIVQIINTRTVGFEYPEMHFTYNSVDTLRKYIKASGGAHSGMHASLALDMMSFSHINPKKDAEIINLFTGNTHINYNHLVPENVTSKNIDKYVEKMTAIGKMVDSIYLVIFKRPIHDKLVQIGDVHRMKQDITYINTLLERLPKDVRQKVHVDGCLEDVIKHRQTGFGCSSNISRFQVWPDGSVTGCAYALGAAGDKPGRTADDIMENIRDAKTRYEFKTQCHLPKVYNLVRESRRTTLYAIGTG